MRPDDQNKPKEDAADPPAPVANGQWARDFGHFVHGSLISSPQLGRTRRIYLKPCNFRADSCFHHQLKKKWKKNIYEKGTKLYSRGRPFGDELKNGGENEKNLA